MKKSTQKSNNVQKRYSYILVIPRQEVHEEFLPSNCSFVTISQPSSATHDYNHNFRSKPNNLPKERRNNTI